MRSDQIRLHPEHGLNPTMIKCLLCGKDTQEIALLGAAYKGKAPMYSINGSVCDDCDKMLKTHIAIVEVKDSFSIKSMTGRIIWINEKHIKESLRKNRIMRMLKDEFDVIMKRASKNSKENREGEKDES